MDATDAEHNFSTLLWVELSLMEKFLTTVSAYLCYRFMWTVERAWEMSFCEKWQSYKIFRYYVFCRDHVVPGYRRPLHAICCYYYYNHFTAVWTLSGTTWVSRYQKKHLPTHTYCGCQSSLICFLHLLWSMASSLFNLLWKYPIFSIFSIFSHFSHIFG